MDDKNIRMYGVLGSHIDTVWNEVSLLIEKALKYSDGKYKIQDIYKSLKNRDMQLWVAFNDSGLIACAVTNIVNFPQKKIMFLLFIAGVNSRDWLHFANQMKQFAKDHGCASIEGYGRPGWEKLSKPFGFEKIHTIFRFNLTEE